MFKLAARGCGVEGRERLVGCGISRENLQEGRGKSSLQALYSVEVESS